MLISEIEPIDEVGINLLNEENSETVINNIIELPLRKACAIFRKKGIETFMSSANKTNIVGVGEEPIEKEDVYGKGKEFSSNPPTFDEAGKGYAWIMLNFDSLSDENKDWLFSLEEKGELGQKTIWFVHPCEMGNLDYAMRVGKYDYEYLKQVMPKEDIPKNITVDPKLVEFEKRHIVLKYNWRSVSKYKHSIFKNANK